MFHLKINTTFLDEIGAISRFTGRFFKEGFKPRYELAEWLKNSIKH